MHHLEALKAVSVFNLLPYAVHDFINDFRSFYIEALAVDIVGSALTKDHVVGTEELSNGARSYTIDDSWLEVNKDGPGYIAACISLIIVYINSFKLRVGVAFILSA